MLLIPVWFDTLRGHEGDTKNGRPLVGPLTWYRAMVHSGEARAAIRQRHGCAVERGAVWLYDALCQMSAHQRIAWRGTLRNQFGRALTVAHLASLLEHPADEIEGLLAVLLEMGWVVDVTDEQAATYYARRMSAAAQRQPGDRTESGWGANGSPSVPQPDNTGDPDVIQRFANGETMESGWVAHGTSLEQSIAYSQIEKRDQSKSTAAPQSGSDRSCAAGAATARNGPDIVFKSLRMAGIAVRTARELVESGIDVKRLEQAVRRCGAYRLMYRVQNLPGLLVRCLRTGLDEEWVENGLLRGDAAAREPP